MIEIHAVYFVVFSQVQASQQERIAAHRLLPLCGLVSIYQFFGAVFPTLARTVINKHLGVFGNVDQRRRTTVTLQQVVPS